MSLVTFERFAQATEGFGEDDAPIRTVVQGAPIAINPVHVAAVFGSNADPEAVIIRLADGRGFVIRGTFESVMAQLPLVGQEHG